MNNDRWHSNHNFAGELPDPSETVCSPTWQDMAAPDQVDAPTTEELQIIAGVAAAERFGMTIQDWTASRIAAQFHGGRFSHLYSLASTGNVNTAGCFRELVATAHEEGRTDQDQDWLHALARYVIAHDGQKPVQLWSRLTHDDAAPFVGRIARAVEVI